MTPTIVFNTANLVARVTGYRFKLAAWGDHGRASVGVDLRGNRGTPVDAESVRRLEEAWLTGA